MVSQTEPRHPTDELLLTLIHEQPSDAAAAIRGHLASCPSCAARSQVLAEQDASIAGLLATLDHPLVPARRPLTVRHSGALRRAAMVAGALATMAGGAAALVPSSPLHRWIVSRTAPAAQATTTVRSAQASTPAAVSGAAPLASGIAVAAPSTLVIEFRHEQETGSVEINRTAPGDVVFRSRGGAAAYDVAEGRVTINNQSPAETYLIDIPTTVRQVRIRMGSRTLLRWPEDSAKYTLPTDSRRARIHLSPATR